jgi:hypothetical protein
MADKSLQIARQHEDNRKHGSPLGAVWIAIATFALMVVSAAYWDGHDSKTAARKAVVKRR